jgi:predicted transcriptional regulator
MVRVTRSVTLHIDQFLQEALDGYAKERRGSASSVVRMAALYWLADRDSARPSWRVPRFRREPGVSGDAVRVGVDDDTWRALEEEAVRQGVDPEVLAEHALLYFLADLDSGRVASRLEHLADPGA